MSSREEHCLPDLLYMRAKTGWIYVERWRKKRDGAVLCTLQKKRKSVDRGLEGALVRARREVNKESRVKKKKRGSEKKGGVQRVCSAT